VRVAVVAVVVVVAVAAVPVPVVVLSCRPACFSSTSSIHGQQPTACGADWLS